MERNDCLSPSDLPSELRDALGPVRGAMLECPGVYYVGLDTDDDYYVVEADTPIISDEVKAYGKPIPGYPGFLLYPYLDRGSGRLLVEYEVCKYKVQHHIPLPPNESLHDTAAFAAEKHPEYFGAFPAPLVTPWGYTLRHKAIDNGVYWIETDRCKEVLAVHSVMLDDLSNAAKSLARQTRYDQKHGLAKTKGYLFFSKRDSCIPVFELMMDNRLYWTEAISKASLMNAIWAYYPEYAAEYNLMEQFGQNDLYGKMLQKLKISTELKSSVDSMIMHTPQVSTDFFGFAQHTGADYG